MAWVAEENFDSYSVGDLTGNNGGSGWSGAWGVVLSDTLYDVVTDDFYGGTKSVKGVNAANLSRGLTTGVSSGVLYYAHKYTSGSSDAKLGFWVTPHSALAYYILFNAGNISCQGTTLVSGFSTSTWYLFEVTLTGSNTLDVRYHDGTSWSTAVTGLAYTNSGSITGINFNCGSPTTFYTDSITATNPLSGGSTPYRRRPNLLLMGVS